MPVHETFRLDVRIEVMIVIFHWLHTRKVLNPELVIDWVRVRVFADGGVACFAYSLSRLKQGWQKPKDV
jgi:hypothetical protein